MKRTDGVSIIIPAYNEAGNIAHAVYNAVDVAHQILRSYEILVVDDDSRDETGVIAQSLARQNSHIRYIKRALNGGLGKAFLSGLQYASQPFVTWYPGDNDTSKKSLGDLLMAREKADLVMTYTANPWTRSYIRRFISWGFTECLNLVFAYHIRYYNGCFITRTELVRSIGLFSTGHAIFAELKIRLLDRGATYIQIPFYHTRRKSGKSSAFRFKNIISTLRTMWMLIFVVRVQKLV